MLLGYIFIISYEQFRKRRTLHHLLDTFQYANVLEVESAQKLK